MALLSNFDDSQTGREIVQDSGVGELFEIILISADVAMRKPNPEIFRHLLGLMKLEPEEVLFVGDTPGEDVLGAQRSRNSNRVAVARPHRTAAGNRAARYHRRNAGRFARGVGV